jgi:hypothetical protein
LYSARSAWGQPIRSPRNLARKLARLPDDIRNEARNRYEAHEAQAGQRFPPWHPRLTTTIEHIQMTDERLESGTEAGGGDDCVSADMSHRSGPRLQPCAAVIQVGDGAHNFDRARSQRAQHLAIDDRWTRPRPL